MRFAAVRFPLPSLSRRLAPLPLLIPSPLHCTGFLEQQIDHTLGLMNCLDSCGATFRYADVADIAKHHRFCPNKMVRCPSLICRREMPIKDLLHHCHRVPHADVMGEHCQHYQSTALFDTGSRQVTGNFAICTDDIGSFFEFPIKDFAEEVKSYSFTEGRYSWAYSDLYPSANGRLLGNGQVPAELLAMHPTWTFSELFGIARGYTILFRNFENPVRIQFFFAAGTLWTRCVSQEVRKRIRNFVEMESHGSPNNYLFYYATSLSHSDVPFTISIDTSSDGSTHHFHEKALSVYRTGSANANTISFIDFIPLWKWSGPDDKIRFTFDSASTDHFVDPISLADSACLADSA